MSAKNVPVNKHKAAIDSLDSARSKGGPPSGTAFPATAHETVTVNSGTVAATITPAPTDQPAASPATAQQVPAADTSKVKIQAKEVLAKGVQMRCQLLTPIGSAASAEAGRYALDSVAILRDAAVLSKDQGGGQVKERGCTYLATDGKCMAVVEGLIIERVVTQESDLTTRLPADFAKKVGGDGKSLELVNGGDETVFGERMVWIDADAGRFTDPPSEGAIGPMIDPLVGASRREHHFIELNIEAINKIAAAVGGNGCLRIGIPKGGELEKDAFVLPIVTESPGRAGILMGRRVSDQAAASSVLGATARTALARWSALPSPMRSFRADKPDPQQTIEAGKSAAPAQSPAATQVAARETIRLPDEPWMGAYAATKIKELGLMPSTEEKLGQALMSTVADIQDVLRKHPQKGLRAIAGIGPGKADEIDAALRKRWGDLKRAHAKKA